MNNFTNKKSLLSYISFLILFLLTIHSAHADDPSKDMHLGATGLKEMTPEEFKQLHKHRIKRVHGNALAIDRKNKDLHHRNQKPLDYKNAKQPEKEIELEDDANVISKDLSGSVNTELTATSATGTYVAPTSVDNSTLPSFPPIANQGSESSCVAFATTYYQASHETCLARGCNNKTSNANILSPRWTYNMINGGSDKGSSHSAALALIERNGAATIQQLPYVVGDYLKWDINVDHWKSALSYRTNVSQYLASVSSSTGAANLKQILANGHVATFATYINSFQVTKIKVDPNQPSPYAGQWAMTYVNGTVGAHLMTVVGYDDTIWIDLNNNGVVDPGEKGAFKIANSWGTGYGNAGYIWAAYDSLMPTSLVAGGPVSSTRVQAFRGDYAYVMTAKASYTPKLVALVTVSHLTRNQMSLAAGISTSTASAPSTFAKTGAFNYQGGAYSFNGSTTATTGTFALDLTDLLPSVVSPMNYYIKLADSTAGNPLVTSAVQLINIPLNTVVFSQDNIGLSNDASTQYVKIPYTYYDSNVAPVAKINSTQTTDLNGTQVTFDGSTSYDLNGSIASYSWNFGDGSALENNNVVNHLYKLPGTYNVTLTVKDNEGASSSATYALNVKAVDTVAPSAPSNLSAKKLLTGKGNRATAYAVLQWTSSTDNVGVIAYDIYRNGILLSNTTMNTFQDSSNLSGTFSYFVIARDAASNQSAASNTVSVSR